jgi:hypothetical protein
MKVGGHKKTPERGWPGSKHSDEWEGTGSKSKGGSKSPEREPGQKGLQNPRSLLRARCLTPGLLFSTLLYGILGQKGYAAAPRCAQGSILLVVAPKLRFGA